MTEQQKPWIKKILEFKKSGKSKDEWCEENKISKRQFGYWFKYLTKNQTTQWIPVEISDDKSGKTKNEQLLTNVEEEIKILPAPSLNIKIGEASVEVFAGTDKDFLIEILRVLQSL